MQERVHRLELELKEVQIDITVEDSESESIGDEALDTIKALTPEVSKESLLDDNESNAGGR
jgi:hypothetical protein